MILLLFLLHTPVWTLDIAPILYKHCTPCHHDGGSAPFSLMTYEEAYVNRYSIAYAVKNTMPPWPADPGLKNEQILTENEIHLIQEWVKSAPYGNPKDTPDPPTYDNDFKADVELSVNYETTSNSDVYRCFPFNVSMGMITAYHCIPGKSVHHILIYTDDSDVCHELDKKDPSPGYTSYWGTGSKTERVIGTWTPGSDPIIYSGMGHRVGKNIIIQVHYAPGVIKDHTRLLMKLGRGRELKTEPFINKTDLFLSGLTTVNSQTVIPKNITMISILPHMHTYGKSINVSLGDKKLIGIQKWRFHWQRTYEFTEPVVANKGDVLKATAVYETDRVVTYGPRSQDEMFMVYITYLEDNLTSTDHPGSERPKFPTHGPIEGKVFDLTGRFITNNISDLPNGVYFVKNKYGCFKIVKI